MRWDNDEDSNVKTLHRQALGRMVMGAADVLFYRTPQKKLEELPPKNARPWHPKIHGRDEPECAGNQWRTRDRQLVMNMADMGDSHLRHAIRFASTLPQHADRLAALLAEQGRRSK